MKLDIKKHLAQDPKASVLLLHGYAEHQGRYAGMIDYLVDAGFDVTPMTSRGMASRLDRERRLTLAS